MHNIMNKIENTNPKQRVEMFVRVAPDVKQALDTAIETKGVSLRKLLDHILRDYFRRKNT